MVTTWNDADETTQVFDSERPEGAASGLERWYISPDGKSKEVLAAREIIERARAGSLSDSTLVWRDGLTDWTRLNAVPELMQAVRAFRASSLSLDPTADGAETLVFEPPSEAVDGKTNQPGEAPRAQHPKETAQQAHGLSLPPLSAVPGGRPGALPPLAAPPDVSPRPPLQTTSGAPLPPPPALPPLGGKKSTQDVSPDGPAVPVQAKDSGSARRSSTSEPASQSLASVFAGLAERVKPVVTSYSTRVNGYLERDYVLPKVGKINGKLLAAGGGGAVALLLVLLVWATQGNEGESTASSPIVSTGPSNSSAADAFDQEETGVDLDDESKPGGEARAVSLKDLKSLRPGEKAPEVAKLGNSRQAGPVAKEFDVYAAKAALTAAATKAARCKQGLGGEGSVRVKIAPSGKVASVAVTTPAFQGTATAKCVEQVFRQATMEPFSGDEKTVYKKFVIE